MGLTEAGFEWEVPAKLVKVIEGNLLLLDLDLGWHVTFRTHVYLPELHITIAEALAARKQAQRLLPPGTPLILLATERHKGSILYGPGFSPRSDEGSFAGAMIASGRATSVVQIDG